MTLKLEELLNESYKITTDLFEFNKVIDDFNKLLNVVPNQSVIALKGRYGSGKSTMLHLLQKKRQAANNKEIWITFDAWKYPEKSSLWEGFVIDVFEEFKGTEGIEDLLKKIKGEKSFLFKFLSTIPALSNIRDFFNRSEANRTFELQLILKSLLYTQNVDSIIFVIEDIDRAHNAGVYFLETLKHFLTHIPTKDVEKGESNLLAEKVYKVIVPVSPEFIEPKKQVSSSSNNPFYLQVKLEYEKIFDHVERFRLEDLIVTNYIKSILDELDLPSGTDKTIWVSQIERFINLFLIEHKSSNLTIRSLKKIFRKACYVYIRSRESNEDLDFRIILGLSFLDYIDEEKRKFSIRKDSNNQLFLDNDNSLTRLIMSVTQNKLHEAKMFSIPIRFIDGKENMNYHEISKTYLQSKNFELIKTQNSFVAIIT